jgi:hypothetical protein
MAEPLSKATEPDSQEVRLLSLVGRLCKREEAALAELYDELGRRTGATIFLRGAVLHR